MVRSDVERVLKDHGIGEPGSDIHTSGCSLRQPESCDCLSRLVDELIAVLVA